MVSDRFPRIYQTCLEYNIDIGIDMIPFRRYPERTLEDLGAEAALLALADAGLAIGDIQALYCGSALQAIAFPGQRVLRQIGEQGHAH